MELLIIDYLVIATLLVSAVLSLIRGFTKEVFSIVNWVIAI
ncbi:MAG: colicin V synthesis protein, partial [Alphaproteobacteria bacterium]|nr:colicin V synthesis protein [Alphaproteobacteria bacterium]